MLFPGCMFSVAMIQRLRLPPATKAMLADLQGSYRTLMTFSVKGSGGAPSS